MTEMDDVSHASSAGLVLIADDNPANLGALFDLLSRERFDVAVANDGDMVLELVGQAEPDLILLDVQMPPGMDGFDACRHLKKDPKTRAIPVIFMTSLDDRQSRLLGFDIGAADFVSKPFDEAELLARIRTHIALRRATRSLAEKNARLEEQIRMRTAAEAALHERSRQLELRSQEFAAINEQLALRTTEIEQRNEQLAREIELRAQNELERTVLQEEMIAVQRQRLNELSVPLIPVTEAVLILPLVGTIDTDRAERILDTVLHGAQQKAAAFVIFDMTGVTGVGPHTPEAVLRAAEGLRLLGARMILTGLRADSARHFVSLGATFGTIVMKNRLQDGIAHALHVLSGSAPSPVVSARAERSAFSRNQRRS